MNEYERDTVTNLTHFSFLTTKIIIKLVLKILGICKNGLVFVYRGILLICFVVTKLTHFSFLARLVLKSLGI